MNRVVCRPRVPRTPRVNKLRHEDVTKIFLLLCDTGFISRIFLDFTKQQRHHQ